MRRLLLAVVAAALVTPAAARAADPIMALSEVQPGMQCTGLSVVRGLEISQFGVEVVDVVDRGRAGAARILVRVSGPAIDATGLGPGFSGSPILCTGSDGIAHNIGAISETIGEYGGRAALATPIEAILAQPQMPPAGTRSVIGARSLAGPLTIAGLRPSLARAFVRAARRAGRTLIASPAGTSAAFAPQPLVPGSSVSVGLTAGDIAIGAIGTVAYTDGQAVWIFGHEMDGAGRRSLFLQDAWIHTVVNNPVAVQDVATYKLGSPGNDLGTITSDGPNGVVGVLGAPPASFPLRVTAKDLDTRQGAQCRHARRRGGRRRAADRRVAAEHHGGRRRRGGRSLDHGRRAGAPDRRAVRQGHAARDTRAAEGVQLLRDRRLDPERAGGAGRHRRRRCRGDPRELSLRDPAPDRVRHRYPRAPRGAPGIPDRRPWPADRAPRQYDRAAPGVASDGHGAALDAHRAHARAARYAGRPANPAADRDCLPTPAATPTKRAAATSAWSSTRRKAGRPRTVGPQSLDEIREAFLALGRYDGVVARLGGEERRLLRDPRLRISGEARVQLRVR